MAPENITIMRWGLMDESAIRFWREVLNANSYPGTGDIAKLSPKELLTNPMTRGMTDIRHVITAVASSSSKQSAVRFIAHYITPT
jgi:hypothetical protein